MDDYIRHSLAQPDERPIDHLIPAAELTGESWARLGFDYQRLIREHSRSWPGGRNGRVRLIAAALAGARRARRAEP